ncbi:hypothetical protein LOK49_LG02G00498 [Camellia lanceoleosa]|uniref:Uncharacterized protein n=1 Tax=Camellia lanceoleosa TaxID=1840588 RepID=A0ACC0IL76_9ERIC|nr:hypothetical protein LOK49_LG02G00498 [Camellia lanceoleosa]
MLSRKDLAKEWCFSFRRPLHAWEDDETARLISLLGVGPHLHLEQGDSMRWKADQTGVFKLVMEFGVGWVCAANSSQQQYCSSEVSEAGEWCAGVCWDLRFRSFQVFKFCISGCSSSFSAGSFGELILIEFLGF